MRSGLMALAYSVLLFNSLFSPHVAAASSKPIILFLGSNISRVTPLSVLDISAVVTSASGVEDVIGGVLLDSSGASYGALVSSDHEGAYGLRLTWDQLNAVKPIVAPIDGVKRTLIARFFSQGGEFSDLGLEVTLGRFDGTHSICDGMTKNLNIDKDNCGVCRRSAQQFARTLPDRSDLNIDDLTCVDGKFNLAISRRRSNVPESCESLCQRKNVACTRNADAVGTWNFWQPAVTYFNEEIPNCKAVPPAKHPVRKEFQLHAITCGCIEI